MKKSTKKTGIIILLAVCILGLSGCGGRKKNVTSTAEEIVQIRTQQVTAQDVQQLYEYTAIVEADKVNNIAPLTGGRIDKIYVEVGDCVTAGTILVQMNENSLRQARSQLDNLKKTFERIDELYKVGGVSKSNWDAQKTALDVAQTTYDNLLENTQLLSPISGVVTQRNYDSGDLFAGKPVVQIQQINPVKMKINLSELLFTKVKIGQSVDIKIDTYEEEQFSGKVSLIYPTIDAITHTFPVEIQLANKDNRVRPGMYAHVTVNFGKTHNVVVPDMAIIKQQGSGNRYVYVCKDNKVYYRQVQIGRRLDTVYEVLSGVRDSDYVAITGLTRLKDGMKVETVQ